MACGACGMAASSPASVVSVAQRGACARARPRVINSEKEKMNMKTMVFRIDDEEKNQFMREG